jgi:type II secretory ATPase GspE/PulE/Tfp pilus assembly ATPase PilB-like protein
MNDVVSDLVLSQSRTRAIHEAAVAGGMVPIEDDAAARVEQGTTTWDEVRRVLPPRIAPESASDQKA